MTNSPTAVPGNISALVALLERQRSIYQQLRTLSDQQGPLVAEGHAEALLSLLAQRQRLIDAAMDINAKLDPYRKRWAEMWATLPAAERERVGALVKDVQDLLAAIVQQDERDRQILQTAKANVGAELQQINRATAAASAYRAAPNAYRAAAGVGSGANRFMNQKG
jgi:hypothetical protein